MPIYPGTPEYAAVMAKQPNAEKEAKRIRDNDRRNAFAREMLRGEKHQKALKENRRLMKRATRQLRLLEAIAAQPGKDARHYAKATNGNTNTVNYDLRVLADDGTVFANGQIGEKIWFIKPLKQDLKPCTLI